MEAVAMDDGSEFQRVIVAGKNEQWYAFDDAWG